MILLVLALSILPLYEISYQEDSCAVELYKSIDFGVITPYADTSRLLSPADYIKNASYDDVMSLCPVRNAISVNYMYKSRALDDGEYSVGQISYQEDVSPTGGRIYTIPFLVSPSSKFPPEVCLQYNSQSGNGVAGYGWNIGGLSSITISNKSLYYHGTVAPANINDPDAVYSLDGLPLVVNDDPVSSIEYPLETSKGHIIAKKHITGNVLESFTVLYPDGSRAVYGVPGSTSSGSVYPITQWEDKYGNQIEYIYSRANLDYRIEEIRFRHKSNSSYIGRLDFDYSLRTDYHRRYRACEISLCRDILNKVTSYSGEAVLFTYDLTHEFDSGVNLLTAISCENSSGESLRPLRFTYGPADDFGWINSVDLVHNDNLYLATYFPSSDDIDYVYNRGKMLSSNYKDGLVIFPNFPNYQVIDTKLQGFTRRKLYGSPYPSDQEILVVPHLTSLAQGFTLTAEEGFQCINLADVDGDGTDEIVKVNLNGVSDNGLKTKLKATISSARTSGIYKNRYANVEVGGVYNDNDVFISPAQRCYMCGDFTGSGNAQLLTVSYSTTDFYSLGSSIFSLIDLNSGTLLSEQSLFSLPAEDYKRGKVVCIDMDSDGRTELCHLSGNNLSIYNFTGNGFTLTKSIYTSPALLSESSYYTDINGDGYTDVAIISSGASTSCDVFHYTGDSFWISSLSLGSNAADDEYLFMDLNRDGLADLIQRSGTTTYLYLNENGEIEGSRRIVSSLDLSSDTEIIPFNILRYNSMSDFLTIENSQVNVYGFTQDLSSERLLTGFTNSLGLQTVNNYEDMSSSDYVYQLDPGRTYTSSDGFAKCRFPLQLLFNTQTYLPDVYGNPSTLLANNVYTYFDACVHKQGLGFLGFGTVRTTDYMGVSDSEPVTIKSINPENMGTVSKIAYALRLTQDTPYEYVEYTYDDHSTEYGKANPRLSNTEHVNTLTSLEIKTVYEYDQYDFPTKVNVSRHVEGSPVFTEIQQMEYLHNAETGNYCLGSISSSVRNNIKTNQIQDPEIVFPISCDAPVSPALEELPLFPGIPHDSIIFIKPVFPPSDGMSEKNWIEKQTFTYNDAMLPISKIDSLGESFSSLNKVRETRWTYDAYGNVLTENSAPFNVSEFIGKTYTYDENGINLLTSTNELGHTTIFGCYNKFGKPQTITDHKGRVTTDQYNDWGELSLRSAPDGTLSSTSYEWGGVGCYTVTASATGKPSSIIHYDSSGRDVRSGSQSIDGQWIYTDKIYHRNGQIQKQSLPFKDTGMSLLWNTYEYDEYGRPVLYTKASGSMTSWSYNGKSTTTSKDGVWSTKTVGSNNQVVEIQDGGGTINYTFRADGQLSEVTVDRADRLDDNSLDGKAKTSFTYDIYGRRKQIKDPSAGTQTDNIVYNSDGSSVVTHTNPNGSIITYSDKYGRTTKIERPGEYTTDYVYSTDGLLASETSSNGTSKTYTYDEYDRVMTMVETVPDGNWLRKTFTYTTGGNVSTIAYESQNGVIATENFTYSNGINVGISLQGTYVRQINAVNEFGQPTSVTTGGITRMYSYSQNGLPARRTMGAVMDFSYDFDPLRGNLISRTDNLCDVTETFGYDDLNRLVSMDDRDITYSVNGNITSIDSVGDMTYDNSAKPYQVTSLTLEDDVVPSRVQNVTYTCYSRPSIMTEGGRSAAFTYNGDGARVKMNVSDGATSVLSRYYIGNQYELDVTPNGTTERLYLGGDAYSAPAVYVKEGSGAWTFYNIGRDYLGNITHIATADGILVEENSYDPWGRLRNPETKEIYSLGTEPELMLGRGYTGHEHLTWFGLINMNARLYDPVLGRFLSPDPFVQMPDFTQNFNRYSYCLNNPLVYVDENGEIIGTYVTFIYDFFRTLFTGGLNFGNKQVMDNTWKEFDPSASWSKTNKAWQIAKGGWRTDENKPCDEQIYSVISRWTLELPQTFAGKIFSHGRNIFGDVEVSYYHEATVVDAIDKSHLGWGLTLSSFINTVNKDRDLVRHEYGHVIQSQKLGLLYIPIVGIPSLAGCGIADISNHKHKYEWYETWANKLSYEYLKVYDSADLSMYPWNKTNYSMNYNLNWYFYVTLGYYVGISGLVGLLIL